MIRPSPILAAVAVVEDWVQVQRSQDERLALPGAGAVMYGGSANGGAAHGGLRGVAAPHGLGSVPVSGSCSDEMACGGRRR